MKKELIPIVFAINDEFVPYFGVALHSIKQNASLDYQYMIYVFHIGMNIDLINKIEKLSDENFIVQCIDVDDYMPNIEFTSTNHVSKETLYRLIVPNVLGQYDKVLWLDADMVILNDISILYKLDIEGNIIGAAPELMHEYIYDYLNDHGMEKESFFNSGVLIIDTKRMLEEKILEKCVTFLKQKHYAFPDQDSLNETCRGKVYLFSYAWNYAPNKIIRQEFPDMEEIYCEASKHPYIIHFTGSGKPWKCILAKTIHAISCTNHISSYVLIYNLLIK